MSVCKSLRFDSSNESSPVFSRSASALGDECTPFPVNCIVVEGLDMSVTADLVVLDVPFRGLSNVELSPDAKHLRARVYYAEADRRRQLHLCGPSVESDNEPFLRHQAQQAAHDQALGAVGLVSSRHVVVASFTRSACSRKWAIVRISFNTTRVGRKMVVLDSIAHTQLFSTR